MSRPLRRLVLLVLLLLAALPARAAEVLVAAAADLRLALPEIAAAFEKKSGHRLKLSFGSSGQFYRQIAQGGPFEVFLSADEGFVLKLAQDGSVVDAGAVYAIGNLALVTAKGVAIEPGGEWAALASGHVHRFSIANPEHAPYGRAAMQVLEARALSATLRDKLVLGDNVAQALQFVTTGAAQAGLVAGPLAQARRDALGQLVPVPTAWHAPLRQRLAVIAPGSAAAREFAAYLLGAEARAVLAKHGFGLP